MNQEKFALLYKTSPLIAGFLGVLLYFVVVCIKRKLDEIKTSEIALIFFDSATIWGGFKVMYQCVFDDVFMPQKDMDLIYPFIGGLLAAVASFIDLRSKFKEVIKIIRN